MVLVLSPTSSLANKPHDVILGKLCHREQFVTVDPFDDQQFRQMVRVAIQFWNDNTGRKLLRYEPTVFSPEKRFWVTVEIASVDDLDGREWGIIRWYIDKTPNPHCISGASIKIEPNIDSYDKKLLVIIHELGHSIGLDHSEVKGTIMYFRINKSTKFILGTDTKKELRELYPRN